MTSTVDELQSSISSQRIGTGWFLIALIALTLLGIGLRLYKLDTWSFWTDEVHTIRHSASAWDGNTDVRILAYPPTALGLWLQGIDIDSLGPHDVDIAAYRPAGVTHWNARLPSTLFAIITIPLLGWFSRRFLGDRAALMVTLLLVIATWHIWMSQSARFYTQQFLFYNLALICWYRAVHREDKMSVGWMIATAVFTFCATTSQLPSLMIVGFFGIDWIIGLFRKPRIRFGWIGWAAMLTAVAVVFVLIKTLRPEGFSGFVGNDQSIPKLVVGTLFMVGWPVLLMAAIGLIAMWKRENRLVTYLAIACIWPMLVMCAISLNGTDTHVRYIFICLYAWLALASLGLVWAIESLRAKPWGWAAGTAVVLLVVGGIMYTNLGYYTSGYGFRERWQDAFRYINKHRQPGDKVALDWSSHYPGGYYLDGEWFRYNDIKRVVELQEAGQTVWVPLLAGSPSDTNRTGWLKKRGRLEGYFDTRLWRPYSSVHVYRLGPDTYGRGVNPGEAGPTSGAPADARE